MQRIPVLLALLTILLPMQTMCQIGNLFNRINRASNFEFVVYNNGDTYGALPCAEKVLGYECTYDTYAHWPRGTYHMEGVSPSSIAFLAKRGNTLMVSDAGFIYPPFPLAFGPPDWEPFSGTVPGRIGDPLAGYDSVYQEAGWRYVDDGDYIVYSSLDYNDRGVDISGNNFNDWPLRLIRGQRTYVADPLERSLYEPSYLSDEDMFCIFKDTDTRFDRQYTGPGGKSEPIGLEFLNYIYSWREEPGKNIVLFQYDIVNKSGTSLDSCYIVYGHALALNQDTGFPVVPLQSILTELTNHGNRLVYLMPTDPSEWTPEHWSATPIPPTIGFPLLQSPMGYDQYPLGIHQFGCTSSADHFRKPPPDTVGTLLVDGNDSIAYRTLTNLRYVTQTQEMDCQTRPTGPVISVGPFFFESNDTGRVTFGVIFSDSLSHLLLLDDFIRRVYNNGFARPSPPPASHLTAMALDRAVKLSWDNSAESATDVIIPDSLGRPFTGYRLLRGLTETGPFVEIGRWNVDSSLVHEFTDQGEDLDGGLRNNVAYYYQLLSFDEGAPRLKLDPMESPPVDGVNAVSVIPSTEPPDIEGNDVTQEMMEGIRIVPNPYLIRHEAQTTSRAIYFNYLPTECTIRIYTIAMDLVKTIHHSGGSREEWDLTTEGGQLVASQMFIVHVESGNGLETIKKFSVVVGK